MREIEGVQEGNLEETVNHDIIAHIYFMCTCEFVGRVAQRV